MLFRSISLIDMPDTGEKQLKMMVPIEARKHIPVPISEVMLNFLIMPKAQNAPTSKSVPVKTQSTASRKLGRVDVLIVAIHNNAINKYQDVKEKIGLRARMFEVEVFSAIRSVAGIEKSTVAVLDIGASVTKIAIVENGILRGSHLVNRGSQDITIALSKSLGVDMNRAEEIKRDPTLLDAELLGQFADIVSVPLGYIYSEVESVLFEYEKNNRHQIKKIVLSGGGVLLEGALGLAKDNFKAEVVLGDPFKRLRTPAFLEDTLKSVGPEFSVAVGLALEAI